MEAADSATTGKRESTWHVVRRCLAMLRRVQRGPARKWELMAAVRTAEGEDAYGYASGKALDKKYEADLRRIRRNLEVDIRYDAGAGGYIIRSLERPLLDLPDAELQTLAFLAETFKPETPHAPEVRRLIDTLLPWLALERRRVVVRARRSLDVDLRRRDSDAIAPDVMAAVQEAYDARQQLQFDYLAASREDGIPRQHTVEPWDYYFDTERGHYYLRGFCLFSDGPDGPQQPNRYFRYRLGRIQPGSAKVLPRKLPPTPRKARPYDAIYELAPEITRFGASRQRALIAEPELTTMNGGWVRVEGRTDDIFRLSRDLLYYGPNCRVLGGRELLREMRELVAGLAEIYQ